MVVVEHCAEGSAFWSIAENDRRGAGEAIYISNEGVGVEDGYSLANARWGAQHAFKVLNLDALWHKGERGGKGVMILWFAQGLGECNEVADSFLHWMCSSVCGE